MIKPDEELTDVMLLDLAKKFSTEMAVHTLAEKGLGIDVSVVRTSLYNHNRDINMAMHDVLRQWRLSQLDAHEAYVTLYEALVHVGMSDLTTVLRQER